MSRINDKKSRVLILSNRDTAEVSGEIPIDSVAPVALSVLKVLERTPGITVAHSPVFYIKEIISSIDEFKPDVVFNLCEGLGGDARRESYVAWLLERINTPFTGCRHEALSNCLYKSRANEILKEAGVKVPKTIRVYSADKIPSKNEQFPMIVKPDHEDGSVGICSDSVVNDVSSLKDQVLKIIQTYKQPACVQQYIPGREFSVSIIGDQALPPGEIVFDNLPDGCPPILTFSSKWHLESVDYKCSKSEGAKLKPNEIERIVSIGKRAFNVLGLSGYGRVDMRIEGDDVYVIDVNPNCVISEGGGFCLAANRAGLTHSDIILDILDSSRFEIRRKREQSINFTTSN